MIDPSLVYYTATDQRAAQSEAEERFLARVASAGIPIVPQVKLGQNWVFDGAITGTKILVEYHGDYWHNRPEVVERDARKQAWADAEGYLIITVWERDEQADPDGELARVVSAYEQLQAFAAAEAAAPNHANHAGVKVRRSHYGDWRDAFLDGLSERGILLDGCEAGDVSYETVRRHRRDDPDFDQAVKDARKAAADRLRRTYFRRAEQQSDRAMEYMLRLLDPDEASGPNLIALLLPYLDLSKLSDGQIEQLSAGGDPVGIILSGVSAAPAGGGGASPASGHGA